jgi:hypothetical protein
MSNSTRTGVDDFDPFHLRKWSKQKALLDIANCSSTWNFDLPKWFRLGSELVAEIRIVGSDLAGKLCRIQQAFRRCSVERYIVYRKIDVKVGFCCESSIEVCSCCIHSVAIKFWNIAEIGGRNLESIFWTGDGNCDNGLIYIMGPQQVWTSIAFYAGGSSERGLIWIWILIWTIGPNTFVTPLPVTVDVILLSRMIEMLPSQGGGYSQSCHKM